MPIYQDRSSWLLTKVPAPMPLYIMPITLFCSLLSPDPKYSPEPFKWILHIPMRALSFTFFPQIFCHMSDFFSGFFSAASAEIAVVFGKVIFSRQEPSFTIQKIASVQNIRAILPADNTFTGPDIFRSKNIFSGSKLTVFCRSGKKRSKVCR